MERFLLLFLAWPLCSPSPDVFFSPAPAESILGLGSHAGFAVLLTSTRVLSLDSSTDPPRVTGELALEEPFLTLTTSGVAAFSLCRADACRRLSLDGAGNISLGQLNEIPPALNQSLGTSLLQTAGGIGYFGGFYSDRHPAQPDDLLRDGGVYGIQRSSSNGSLFGLEYGPRAVYTLNGATKPETYDAPPVEFLGSFASGAFVYFLRNVAKEAGPEMAAKAQDERGYDVPVRRSVGLQLAQVCASSSWDPDPLGSWVNVPLSCGGLLLPAAEAVFLYSSKTLLARVAAEGHQRLCWWRLEELEAAFQEVYESCQNRPLRSGYNHFDVVSRGDSGADFCVKRDCHNSAKVPRCAAASSSLDCAFSIRLDSFRGVSQSGLSDNVTHGVLAVVPGPGRAAALIRLQDGGVLKLDLRESRHGVAVATPYALPGIAAPDPTAPVATLPDALLILDKGKLRRLGLSCGELLSSCAALPALSPAEGCVWCTDVRGNGSGLSKADCPPENFPLLACPPQVIRVLPPEATADGLRLGFHGTHLAQLRELSADVCGQPCKMDAGQSSPTCTVAAPSLPDNCRVVLSGTYGPGHPFRFTKSLSPTGSSREEDRAADSSLWLGLGALVLLLLLGGAFVAFLLRRRAAAKKRRTDSSSLAPLDGVGGFQPRPGNRYGGHARDGLEMSPPPYEDMSYLVPAKLRIPYASLNIASEIGSGHFGVVYKAIYLRPAEPPLTVAVKTLNSPSGVREFLKEGLRMENFEHERVLGLLGITFLPENNYPMLVTPFMPRGDLLSFLQSPDNAPTLKKLLGFCVEIAEGMAYLHKIKFIHRDLAARNCMLDENLRLRIADFGLTRDVYNEDGSYVPQTERFLPLRWLALEGIERWTYTYKGDVWAYGVTCWEITTRGQVPYHEQSSLEVMDFLKAGKRLAKPDYCPDSLYAVMRSCWDREPKERPSFGALCLSVPAVIAELEARGKSIQIPLHHSYVNYGPGEGDAV